MKKTITSIILTGLLITSLFTTGCVSTNPTVDKQRRVETSLQAITQVGISVLLTDNPKIRPGLIRAIEDLRYLETGTNNITITDVLVIVQRLDIKELQSPQGVLYLSTGILLLTEFNVPTALPLEQSKSIRGISGAIRRGLEVALQSVPETLPTSLPRQ